MASRVQITHDDDAAHVVLAGEFDTPESEHLLGELQPLLEAPPPVVVLNLQDVEFGCSRIIGVFERLRTAVTSKGGQLQIGPRPPIVERLFIASGFLTE